ncbi:uncharacterized protein LOC123547742 isoform X2 [Mercenaria mercenaria]|uniref:uncharacterized protein LOC123547742 isoform X2 n=1 Tax=Mercenaria mercenaria TaxID=6596 RepID=UPI001E1D56DF|nr:uncharacterized protein LOC123547742 isoform X2 [Mercenaria mercenaria]
MWTTGIFISFLVGCISVSGFMFDDPCDVFPQYSGGIPNTNDFTTTVKVPANCRNGTFRWDYPKGHTMLEFQNVHETERTICIKDSLGGDVFNITDKAYNQRLGKFDYKHWACFQATSARVVMLQVDAPLELRYMGEIEYKITD